MMLAGQYVPGTETHADRRKLREKVLKLRREHDIEPDLLAERFGLTVCQVYHILKSAQRGRKK